MSDSCALVLTNSEDATADYLCAQFDGASLNYVRFDTDTPLETVHVSLQDRDLCISCAGRILRPHEIHTIVYRRPKPFEVLIDGDEYQRKHAIDEWAEAVEGFLAHVPDNRWINHPTRNFQASHKVQQLTRARQCGLIVAPWIVTSISEEAEKFLNAHGPVIVAKPLASGFIERNHPTEDTLIYTCKVDQSYAKLFDRLPGCPVLFQARVAKEMDVRLVVVDNRVAAVSLLAQESDGLQRLDIRRDNMQDVQYGSISVPAHIENSVNMFMKKYGLRFGALDFAIDSDGQWIFFEVNPNGQWAWLDLVGASDIGSLFIDALLSPVGI